MKLSTKLSYHLFCLSLRSVIKLLLCREAAEMKREFKLKEDDILRIGRLILPAANLGISIIREIFSGEPAMTLKVDYLCCV